MQVLRVAALVLALSLLAGGEVILSAAQKHIDRGNQTLDRGDAVGAAAAYRQALAIDPQAVEARVNLGAALLRLGDAQGALTTLESARKLEPESAPLLRNLTRAYLLAGLWDDAVAAARAAHERAPAHADAEGLLGTALHRSGDAAGSLPHLREAATRTPQDLEIAVELAWAAADARDAGADPALQKARKLRRKSKAPRVTRVRAANRIGLLLWAAGERDAAVDEFLAAIALDPDHVPAQANLGMALVDLGKPARALPPLQLAARSDPGPRLQYYLGIAHLETGKARAAVAALEAARSAGFDPPAVEAALAQAYEKAGQKTKATAARTASGGGTGMSVSDAAATEGLKHLRARRYSKAAAVLKKAADLRPNDGAVHFNLGIAHRRLRDPVGAIPPLTKAAALLPKQPRVWYHLALAQRDAGRRAAAVESFGNVIELQPRRADVAALRGRLLLEMGRDQQAVRDLTRAAKAMPGNARVQYDLAVAHQRLGNDEAALAPLSRYLTKRPRDVRALEARAQARLATGKAKGAVADLNRLAKVEPHVARHRVNLAIAHRKAGNRAAEKKALRDAAVHAPDDAAVLADLARLEFEDQEWEAAAGHFERAGALDPNNETHLANAKTARANLGTAAEAKSWDEIKRTHLHLGVVITREKKQCVAARKKVLGGKPFEHVAKSTSVHETAAKGGDLGWQHPDALPPWARVAKKLEPGKVSPVVPLDGGFAFFYRFKD